MFGFGNGFVNKVKNGERLKTKCMIANAFAYSHKTFICHSKPNAPVTLVPTVEIHLEDVNDKLLITEPVPWALYDNSEGDGFKLVVLPPPTNAAQHQELFDLVPNRGDTGVTLVHGLDVKLPRGLRIDINGRPVEKTAGPAEAARAKRELPQVSNRSGVFGEVAVPPIIAVESLVNVFPTHSQFYLKHTPYNCYDWAYVADAFYGMPGMNRKRALFDSIIQQAQRDIIT